MSNRYSQILVEIFRRNYKGKKCFAFEFDRNDIINIANELAIELPKNLGDIIYSFRYRSELPVEISKTARKGKEWVIDGAGRSRYRFSLKNISKIEPRIDLVSVKIPDNTPEIIEAYALNDEQALLAKLRYNRLIDIFLGITAYSLQNHLRTTVKGVGQIEIDEIYVGINKQGSQFIIPVQAKSRSDKIGTVQTRQDVLFCTQKYPSLICRPLTAQFVDEENIALFELVLQNDEIKVVEEKHYQLAPYSSISDRDLEFYLRSTP